jgi:hypothetical protein
MLRLSGLAALHSATQLADEDCGHDEVGRLRVPVVPAQPHAKVTKPAPAKPVGAPIAPRELSTVAKETRAKASTVTTAMKAPAGARFHTSIYLPRGLRRRLREIAAAEECKVHDLLISRGRRRGFKSRRANYEG